MKQLFSTVLRSLPAFPGKLRIAKLLLNGCSGPAIVKDRAGFTYEVPDLREPIAFHLLVNGTYEPEIQNLLHRLLTPGSTFIDVGANIGTFAIPAAQLVGANGTIVAIEGSPAIIPFLERNLARNGAKNVRAIHAAAGAVDGEVDFYPAPPDHFGMGSRAPQFSAQRISVPSITLDSLAERLSLQRIDVVKIDVEGAEFDVLKGAARLLDGKHPPVIVFEFCDWAEERLNSAGAAQHFLFDRGFQIWRAADYGNRPPLHNAITIGTDMLVARRR